MYQIIAHAKPTEESEQYGKIVGAYAVLFINYKDIDGAYELAKYYIEDNDYEILEFEEEYFTIESKNEMDDDYKQYYEEIFEYGYSLIFNAYENDD